MIKIFPYTADGDQISIKFDYDQEKWAFESGVDKLRIFVKCIENNKGNDRIQIHTIKLESVGYISATSIKEKGNVLTTLEMEILQKNMTSVVQILGVNVCNIISRNELYMRKFL